MIKGLIAATALAVVAFAAPAGAQQYPPAVNSLTISDTTPSPGQTITIVGQTFAQGSSATVTLFSDPVVLGSATADASGIVALQATIPTNTPLGSHTLVVDGTAPDGTPLSLSASITVVPADGTGTPSGGSGSSSDDLPRTGDDASLPLAKLGLALAAVGGLITAVAAKRRKAAATTAGPSPRQPTPV
jgi:LPXTG-motif cell wall-anchored protein